MRIIKGIGKIPAVLAVALMIICGAVITAGAQADTTVNENSYSYIVKADGSVKITGYTGKDTNLEIPSVLGEKPVTEIGDTAFFKSNTLVSVTIPETVEKIGSGAFIYCSKLKSIAIPDSVKSVGGGAFDGTEALTSQTDDIKYIDKWLVQAEKSITEAEIKPDTMGIAAGSFSGCRELTAISVPESVKTIGDSAFWGCSALAEVNFASGLEIIEGNAFRLCYSIAAVTLPDSVTYIGDEAFNGCLQLSSANIPEAVSYVGYQAFFDTSLFNGSDDQINYLDNWVLQADNEITGAKIPTGTVGIAGGAFGYCYKLTSVTIPATVKSIGAKAFIECNALKSVVLPRNAKPEEYSLGYYISYSGENASFEKIQDFTMSCYLGSEAEKYAIANQLNYTLRADRVSGFKSPSVSSTKIRLSWNGDSAVTGYIIEKHNGKKWERYKKITDNKTETYLCEKMKSGTVYKFRMMAYVNKNGVITYSPYTSTVAAVTKPAAVTTFTMKDRTDKTMKLAWTKNATATGYILEMKSGGKWAKIKTFTKNSTTSCTKINLKPGTAYSFRLRTYKEYGGKTLYGAYKTISNKVTKPSKISNLRVTDRGKDYVRIKWDKNTSATGFVVEMHSGKKWTKLVTISKNSAVNLKKTKLKSKTEYKFRVRPYKKLGSGIVYGEYSYIKAKTL